MQEKEFLLRQGMEVMGLNVFVYWITWLITNVIMNSISAVLLITAGFVFRLDFFYLNDPMLYFTLFFMFGVSMVAFARKYIISWQTFLQVVNALRHGV